MLTNSEKNGSKSIKEICQEIILEEQVRTLGRRLVDQLTEIKFLLNIRPFVVLIIVRKSGQTTFETISNISDFSLITNDGEELYLKEIHEIEFIGERWHHE